MSPEAPEKGSNRIVFIFILSNTHQVEINISFWIVNHFFAVMGDFSSSLLLLA